MIREKEFIEGANKEDGGVSEVTKEERKEISWRQKRKLKDQ